MRSFRRLKYDRSDCDDKLWSELSPCLENSNKFDFMLKFRIRMIYSSRYRALVLALTQFSVFIVFNVEFLEGNMAETVSGPALCCLLQPPLVLTQSQHIKGQGWQQATNYITGALRREVSRLSAQLTHHCLLPVHCPVFSVLPASSKFSGLFCALTRPRIK